jgi:putative membrane protein
MRFCATITLLALFAGCGEKAGQPGTETTASTATTSETTTTIAENATAPGGTVSTVPPADKEFAAKAGEANLAEIQMGQLALQKASSADVKAFAQRMVTDHTAAGDKFKPIVTAKGLAVAAELSGDAKAAYDHLSSLSGAEFDKAYIGHMVEDHQKAESLFSTEATSGGDADLKEFAAETLPTIQKHSKLAQQLAAR